MDYSTNPMTRFASCLMLLTLLCTVVPGIASGAVNPSPGFEIQSTNPLVNDLGFQIMIGSHAADGNLYIGTRSLIGPGAHHNILMWDGISDFVVSDSTQYPPPPRLLTDIIRHASDTNLMHILDGGQFGPTYTEDGRLCLLNLTTGVITILIDAGGSLWDPMQMDRDPISGNLYIADRGGYDVNHDGEVLSWNGSFLSTVFPNIDARGIHFLDDGTYYLSARIGGLEGVYHVMGSTVLDTVATGIGLGTLGLLETPGAMPAGLYLDGGTIYWLPDADGDHHADSVNTVATGAYSFGFTFDSAGHLITSDSELNVVLLRSALTDVPEPDLAPDVLHLHPAAPNPFSRAITISFELPAPAPVRLAVFDVAGRRVRLLVDGERHAAGRHSVIWNGRDDAGRAMSSGTYFYRLEAGRWGETKRMTLVK